MKSILGKMVNISRSIGFVEFDGKNEHFNYKFASAAGMLRRLNQELAEYGVVAFASDEDCFYDKDAGCWASKLSLTWACADTGECITSVGVGGGKDKGDKGPMKASTAAMKYAIAHGLTLGWGAIDPEETTGDASKLPDPKKVKAAIDKAKSVATLEKSRGDIRMLRQDASYQPLIEAFKKKEEELKNG